MTPDISLSLIQIYPSRARDDETPSPISVTRGRAAVELACTFTLQLSHAKKISVSDARAFQILDVTLLCRVSAQFKHWQSSDRILQNHCQPDEAKLVDLVD
jgi:hypothetical protein